MATQTLLTAEQFLELPEEEGIIRELDEGRLVEMAPPNLTHGIMVSRVSTLLTRHVEKKGAGFWLSPARVPACHRDPANSRCVSHPEVGGGFDGYISWMV